MKIYPKTSANHFRKFLRGALICIGLASTHGASGGEIIVDNEPREIGEWHAIIGGMVEPRYFKGDYPQPWAAVFYDKRAEGEFTVGPGPGGRHSFGLANLNPVAAAQWTRKGITLKSGTYRLSFSYQVLGEAVGRFNFRFYGSAFATESKGGKAEDDGAFSFKADPNGQSDNATWTPFHLTFKVADDKTEMRFNFQSNKAGATNIFYFTDFTVERIGD